MTDQPADATPAGPDDAPLPEGPDDAPLPAARPRLDLDGGLVPEQTADDTDAGWGERRTATEARAAELRRYLDEKPPHHGD